MDASHSCSLVPPRKNHSWFIASRHDPLDGIIRRRCEELQELQRLSLKVGEQETSRFCEE
jgi:hypothetical protein